jgi:hypothetical protein
MNRQTSYIKQKNKDDLVIWTRTNKKRKKFGVGFR